MAPPTKLGSASSRCAQTTRTPPQTASNDTRCHLLKLPPELRLMIWEYCIINSKLPQRRKSTERRKDARSRYIEQYKQPALLLTSNIVRAEVLRVYLRWLQITCRQVTSGLEIAIREMQQTQRETKQARRELKATQDHIKCKRAKLDRLVQAIWYVEPEVMEKALQGGWKWCV